MDDTNKAMTNQPIQPKPQVCSICGHLYTGHGNNAWPVNPGRCCDSCDLIVVNYRIQNYARGLNAYADPEWYAQIITSVTEFWQEHKKQQWPEDAEREADVLRDARQAQANHCLDAERVPQTKPTNEHSIQMGASVPPAGQAQP